MLQKAQNSQKESVIGQEKEAIRLAWNSLQIESRISGTPITTNIFEEELNKNNSNDAEVNYEDDDETKGFLVEFSKTHNQYTVDKNGNITYVKIIIEEDVEPTETIYATLYDDGTLAFSNDNSKDMNKVVINTYSIAKNDIFETEDDIPWKNERTQVIYVDFVNKIVPLNTQRWFQGCENLIEFKHMKNLNTSNVTSLLGMYLGCSKLESINVKYYNTKNVTNFRSMFQECSSLTELDVTNFYTANAINMRSMFQECSNLTKLDLTSFDTRNVTDMSYLFTNSNKIQTIYVGKLWSVTNVTKENEMFLSCDSLLGGNGTKYDYSNQGKNYARIDKSGQTGYFTDINQGLEENNTPLEYIETTGVQYIDTGYKTNQTTEIEIDIYPTESDKWLFGSRTDTFNIDRFGLFLTSDPQYWIIIGNNDTSNYSSISNVLARHKIYLSNSKLKIDGNEIKAFTSNVTNGNVELCICTMKQESYIDNRKFVGKIYSFKIWDNGTLVRELVPVKNTITNSAGLYDRVEKKFYPNLGSGSFTTGPAKSNN